LHSFESNIIAFRNARNWKQYHTPKNLAASIAIEAAELLEIFQWVEDLPSDKRTAAAEEIADIYIYLATLAYDLDISIEGAVEDKLKKNGKKYPVDKCYGKADKYQGD
jgi:NTP pyrophosphatase (non-canonical NTP hydrolase)